MKQVLKIAYISSFLLVGLTINMVAQFLGKTETIKTLSEVRKDSTIQYSVNVNHQAGDQYRWEIIGGTPTVTPSSGSGITGDPYVINFTPNLPTISVRWNADDHTVSSFNDTVRVQKLSNGCYTSIQTQPVTAWSAATARILDANPSPFCNGGNFGLEVNVTLTGAPNFDLDYKVVSTLTGTADTLNRSISNITGNTAIINIPDRLINTTNTDQYYRIYLTRMNDNFMDNGTHGTNIYEITVRPAASIGTIVVSPGSLQRRQ